MAVFRVQMPGYKNDTRTARGVTQLIINRFDMKGRDFIMLVKEGKTTVLPSFRETTYPGTSYRPEYLSLSPYMPLNMPLNELSQIRHTMLELFSDLFKNGTTTTPFSLEPAVELWLEDDELNVECVMPGVNKNEIHVNATSNIITISAETRRDREIKNEHILCSERRFGKFFRTIPLPFEIKNEQIEAQYKNGVLKLRVPVAEPACAKGVQVSIK